MDDNIIVLYPPDLAYSKIKEVSAIIMDISLEQFFDVGYEAYYSYKYLAYSFDTTALCYYEWLIVAKDNKLYAIHTGSISADSFPSLYPDLTPAKFYFDCYPEFFQKKTP